MLFSNKENEILPLATAWMNLEGIILSEINQRKRDKKSYLPYDFTYM